MTGAAIIILLLVLFFALTFLGFAVCDFVFQIVMCWARKRRHIEHDSY